VRRLAVCVAVAGLAWAATAAAAAATIVPQRGIGGVTLGMTEPQVRQSQGEPIRLKNGRNEFGRYRILRYPTFQVTFQGLDKVTAVQTTSPKQRTVAGIGVGSRKAQVKAKVPGVVCEPGHCHLGKFLPGRRVTDFFLGRTGLVTRVVVGFVID